MLNNNHSEKQLEDFLVENIHLIEDGMTYVDRQVHVTDGIIDILARDKNSTLCIIELKAVDDSKDLVYQCGYYPTQFNEPTRMIAIAPNYIPKILRSLSSFPNVEILRYSLEENQFKLEDMRSISLDEHESNYKRLPKTKKQTIKVIKENKLKTDKPKQEAKRTTTKTRKQYCHWCKKVIGDDNNSVQKKIKINGKEKLKHFHEKCFDDREALEREKRERQDLLSCILDIYGMEYLPPNFAPYLFKYLKENNIPMCKMEQAYKRAEISIKKSVETKDFKQYFSMFAYGFKIALSQLNKIENISS